MKTAAGGISRSHLQWMKRDREAVLGWRYAPPLVFERGSGLSLFDVDGRPYTDCTSGMMSLPLGHCHPELTEVLREQAGRFVHHSSWYTNSRIIEFAEKLCATLPAAFGRINFAVTGSEANEVALRMARAATGGTEFVSALRGLHGGTLAMETITNVGGARKSGLGPLMSPTRGLFVDVPFSYRSKPFGATEGERESDWVAAHLDRVREQLDLVSTGEIAAIILETVLVAGGFIIPPVEWLRGIRSIADDVGALLILDEAQFAPARSGTMWCFEQAGVEPDIVTFAKGMGAGMPLCGAIASKDVAERARGRAGIPWSGTFPGDPLGATVAAAQLDVIERDRYCDRATALGTHLQPLLRGLQTQTACVGDIRGVGMYHVLDIVSDDVSRMPNPEMAEKIRVNALELGLVLIVVRNFIRLCPSLIATESDLADIVERLTIAIQQAESGYSPSIREGAVNSSVSGL